LATPLEPIIVVTPGDRAFAVSVVVGERDPLDRRGLRLEIRGPLGKGSAPCLWLVSKEGDFSPLGNEFDASAEAALDAYLRWEASKPL
jgi:hypothetical protein